MSGLYLTELAECCPDTTSNQWACLPRKYPVSSGWSKDSRLKEHQRRIRLEHPDKSVIAEHTVDLGHRIQFHKTSILATKSRYMDRIVREAIEIELHPNNMSREVGFYLSKSWKPLICSL
jgi:hypothetical protein